jgi:hypothetical protein
MQIWTESGQSEILLIDGKRRAAEQFVEDDRWSNSLNDKSGKVVE